MAYRACGGCRLAVPLILPLPGALSRVLAGPLLTGIARPLRVATIFVGLRGNACITLLQAAEAFEPCNGALSTRRSGRGPAAHPLATAPSLPQGLPLPHKASSTPSTLSERAEMHHLGAFLRCCRP
eukprot:4681852-Prymnesium_polylepis.1